MTKINFAVSGSGTIQQFEPFKLKDVCEGNLLGYGECNNKPRGSIGSLVGGRGYDLCTRCYFKTFPHSCMMGRTEDEIIDYYQTYGKFPPPDTSMGYNYRDYDEDRILERMGR